MALTALTLEDPTLPAAAIIAVLESGRLFPPGASLVAGRIPDVATVVYPEEEVSLASASAKRRREFSAGRTVARRAIRALGIEVEAIPARADRSPVWPDGITASISHSGDICAAVAARKGVLLSIGLDVEITEPSGRGLARYIAGEEELCRASGALGEDGLALRVLFSAKEAFFKAWHPLFGTWLDFHDVRVGLGQGAQNGTDASALSFDAPNMSTVRPLNFQGRWQLVERAVLVGVTCSLSGSDTG
ncbi:hypothetical protein MMB232_03257 (plasmid) [Brevundimonas subvibrioides]|uniref:4'-phosphopantetheinyl transferase family protein n=1 Tax=Caulobacteraceae TaxID=76892 RepID=UPI0032D59DB4